MSSATEICVAVLWCLVTIDSAFGQWIGKQTGCYADSIAANPNRPTVSNPAHVTQFGVVELEYGLDRMWPEEGVRQTSAGGLLKFGLLCDVELRWNTTSFLSKTSATGTHSTLGDNWLGTEIRFHRQTRWLPTMAFSYAFKIPSASTADGLGTGHVDHSFTFGASEAVAHFTFDFNFTQFLIGQPSGGFDHNQQMALVVSHVIYKRLQFAGEIYGQTQLNNLTPGFASSLWALTYTVAPRFVIDGGFEAGLTSGGPHRHVFGGITYSIANLYPGWRRRQSRTLKKPTGGKLASRGEVLSTMGIFRQLQSPHNLSPSHPIVRPGEQSLLYTNGLRQTFEIQGLHVDGASTRAVNVANQEERDGYSNGHN